MYLSPALIRINTILIVFLRGQIKGFNSTSYITTILFEVVSYRNCGWVVIER